MENKTMNMSARFQMRRDTLENWNTYNPLPLAGEPCIAFTPNNELIFKIGDGVHNWRDLAVMGQSVAPHKHSPYKTLNPTYEVL